MAEKPEDRIQIEDAIHHPWVTGQNTRQLKLQLSRDNLMQTSAKMKQYKRAVNVVSTASAWSSLVGR